MAVFSVTLFGMLQSLHGQRTLELESDVPVSVATLQQALIEQLGGCNIPVALAETTRILAPEEILDTAGPLLALPPVCGG